MTLPFRRRHNDAEATHDRARALSSRRLLESLDADDEAWLNRHLDACTECRREEEAFAADRQLLRSLRDKPIEPPRDLWAKTSAALDLASARQSTPAATRRPFWRSLPVGTAAGVLVLLVVVGTALLPGVITPRPAGSSGVAQGSPAPTPITVAAARIGLLRPSSNGTFDFVYTDVDAVCPHARPECVPPPAEHEGSNVSLLGAKASTVTLSPNSNQVVYEAEDDAAPGGHKILIVPVADTGAASPPPESPTTSPSAGASATPSAPGNSAKPTPVPTPAGQIEIASGVTIVGDVAYSQDGKWLAFSAAPKDGSTGPDLYIYAVGGDAAAAAVTTDHQTYFSAWLGNKVLASDIAVPAQEPQKPGNPKASDAPGASGQGNNGQGNGQGRAVEGQATSFLLDPESGARTELAQPDMWMPVVDPKGRLVAYWAGTLRSNDGVSWQLGEGHLVLDRWLDAGAAPDESADASGEPAASAGPGPAGDPTPIVTSHVEDFVAKFDPDGIRLAVWVSESATSSDGRLHLVVIDPATGAIGKDQPLPGEPALRRFSIGENRLAWVSPSGQDGHESSLQVLGWSGDTFGQIESEPSADLLILR